MKSRVKKWELLGSRYVFESIKWMKVRKDRCSMPDGREVPDYYVVEVQPYCMVVAVTDAGNILLVREYKHAVGEVILQLPAGLVDAKDKRPATAARRELEEETGYKAGKLQSLGSFYVVPGRLNNQMHLFLATQLRHTGKQHLDATEDLEVLEASPRQCRQWIKDGTIADQATALGIFLYLGQR